MLVRSRSVPVVLLVTAVAVASVLLFLSWSTNAAVASPPVILDAHVVFPQVDPWRERVAQWLNGSAPADSFRESLRTDTEYITTWFSAGWTNDFMSIINMIYLGLITRRTPVIPPFAPSHLPRDAGFPAFSDVFDVPSLSAAISSPLLEWRDVKRQKSTAVDPLACWSIWSLIGDTRAPRYSLLPEHLNLDVSYTPLPPNSPRMPSAPDSYWLPFSALAPLQPQHSNLVCFDIIYYIGAASHDEWWADWSPAWRIVGTHARWTHSLERIAASYVRRALALDEHDGGDADVQDPVTFPPYICVHVRRRDFVAACNGGDPDSCFPPLTAYVRRVAQIREQLSAQFSTASSPPLPVLVTSDETAPAWWDAVAALGWRHVDHERERTAARLGAWYVPFVDAVVQSRAIGFVGTDRSTMSLVAKRRVEDWQGGLTYLVRLGGEHADDD